mgnify:CR=1 FL=1
MRRARPGTRCSRSGDRAAAGERRREAPTHLAVGRVLAPWGRSGQVRAEILTSFPQRFARLRQVLVGEELTPYRLESARLHKGTVILKLEGVDDPSQAAQLRGRFLYVPLAEAMPLAEDQYYHHQILGLDVWTTEGTYLGQVSEIIETGANDVYVARKDAREVLIPALSSVVLEVDLERHRLVVSLPPGLLGEEEG